MSYYKIYKVKNSSFNKNNYKLIKINLTLNKKLKELKNLNNRKLLKNINYKITYQLNNKNRNK